MAFKSLATSGIVNFNKYQNALVGNAAYVPVANGLELISTTILSSAQSSVSFNLSGFGSMYKHLQIRVVARTSRTDSNSTQLYLQTNSNTSTTYYQNRIYGDGSGIAAQAFTSANPGIGWFATGNDSSGVFGTSIIDILDAFSSNKNKTIRVFNGSRGVTSWISLHSTSVADTAPITTVTIPDLMSGALQPGSRFSVYGVKG
jgi:hypothetical protein